METKNSPFKMLDKKTKFWYIFLCIITFGIFYFYIRNKIKNINNENCQEKAKAKNQPKLGFDINQLIDYLGSINNIETIEESLSSVKITVKNKSLVKVNEIKQLGAKGIMISNNKVNIVFGDLSSAIAQSLKNKLKD